MADHITRALLKDRSARVVAVVTTDTAREAARRHGVVAGGAVALARATASGLLLATLTKGGERVTLQVLGDGPLGGVTVDANDDGDVRAYLKEGTALIAGGAGRRVSLGHAVGRSGLVSVIRDLGLRERYSGQSQIVSGEIDEDVEGYLRESEQIDSALGCDAVLADGMDLGAAGGVLVQCLPGGEGAHHVTEARERLRAGALYDALAAGAPDAAALIRAAVGSDAELELLDTRPVRFRCSCSRERVVGMLVSLGKPDLESLLAEPGPAEVICNFCNEKYVVEKDELARLHADLGRPGGGQS